MSDFVEIGTVATVELPSGETVQATRIISMPQVRGDGWKPYISERLPRNMEGVPCTPSGKAIITSRSQEANVFSEFGFERD